MLSSCANPSCSNQFRYLHQGKLFLLKCSTNKGKVTKTVDFAGHVDYLHYAWLCDNCSQTLEVVLDSADRVMVRVRRSGTPTRVAAGCQ